MEILLKDKLLKSLETASEILIYGAGLYAKRTYSLLKEVGWNDKVNSFVVTDKSNQPDYIDGIAVIPINSINKFDLEKCVMLIAVNENYNVEIAESLNNFKFQNLVILTDYVLSDKNVAGIFNEQYRKNIGKLDVLDNRDSEADFEDRDFINDLRSRIHKQKVFRLVESVKISYINNYLIDEWKEELINIENNYKEIRLHWFYSNRIGEMLARLCVIMEDSAVNRTKGILDLFVCCDSVSVNHALLEVCKRRIAILESKTEGFWIYILKNYKGKISTDRWRDYVVRDNTRQVTFGSTLEWMKLTDEENRIVEVKKIGMGVKQPYICIFNREATYLKNTAKGFDYSYHDYRDSNIAMYKSTADYMRKKNIQLVRMGQYYEQKVEFDNCIDYAIKYYDDLMDLALMRDCKFYIGTETGLLFVPVAFAKYGCIINRVGIGLGGAGSNPRIGEENLFITKKYYSDELGRFLSLMEMLLVDNIVRREGHKYENLNIKLFENSDEEILDVAIEMNDRLDGKWEETEVDNIRQQKYRDIMSEYYNNTPSVFKTDIFYCRIGSRFLEKNEFLLDDNVEWDMSIVHK